MEVAVFGFFISWLRETHETDEKMIHLAFYVAKYQHQTTNLSPKTNTPHSSKVDVAIKLVRLSPSFTPRVALKLMNANLFTPSQQNFV